MIRGISDAEGHFIAGFMEGEAHLGIVEANGGQSFRCLMSLKLRDDDTELVEWLRARLSVGTLHAAPARATSNPQVQWLVQSQDGCSKLVDLLTAYEMRGRKAREFEIWKRAVHVWVSGARYRTESARHLRRQLLDVRRFRAPDPRDVVAEPQSALALAGYLHGFVCAEGSFSLDRSHTGLTVHLRQDDRPLLEMLARAVGVGSVRDQRGYPPTNPSSTWAVTRLDAVAEIATRLDPAQMRGRKARELEVWLRAVEERLAARASPRRADVSGHIAEFRAAREYRPGKALSPKPDADEIARQDALRILREWAAREPGALTCTRYAAAREPGWPTRNTIAGRFGSWDAALRAAGLGHRLARTEPRRVGGEAGRKARADAQRERVLQTLRYLITVHGTIPTAMEFFRARLVEAPATPTQATVYRLFPGGWQAVLDALGEVDPGVLCSPAPADRAR